MNAMLLPGRRENLRQKVKKICQQKARGTQTDPLFFFDETAAVLPNDDFSANYLAQKELLNELQRQISNLELKIMEKNLEIHDERVVDKRSLTLLEERNGVPPSSLMTQGGNHFNQSVPYKELSPRNVSLDYGRGLLSEISYKLEECRELVHQRGRKE